MTTTMPTAVQPVPPALGAEELTAMRADPPWLAEAPPPSSLVPVGQLAVETAVVTPAAEPLPALVVVPITTLLLATVPAGP
jgi:hypothetical protein